VNVSLAILWKDLLIEWRSRDRVVAMILFSLLVVVIFHFALPGGASSQTRANAPGLLWVAYVFAALFGLGRAFSLELENDAFSGLALAPADRGWVFLGKAAANLVILGVVQAVTALAFALVFGLELAKIAAPRTHPIFIHDLASRHDPTTGLSRRSTNANGCQAETCRPSTSIDRRPAGSHPRSPAPVPNHPSSGGEIEVDSASKISRIGCSISLFQCLSGIRRSGIDRGCNSTVERCSILQWRRRWFRPSTSGSSMFSLFARRHSVVG